jgi:hypothetical protein
MLFGYLFVLPAFTEQNLFAPSTHRVRLTMTLLKIPEFDNKKFQVICRAQLSCQKQVASITADLMLVMGVDCFKFRHFFPAQTAFRPKP